MFESEKLNCNVSQLYLTIDVKMNEDKWREFGQLLKKERELTGLLQKTVAEKIPMSVVQLSRIENGHNGTKRETIVEIIRTINKHSESGYKIDEEELLNKAGFTANTENEKTFPKELQEIDFDILSEIEKQEIVDFAKYKEYRARIRNSENPASRFETDDEFEEKKKKSD